VPPQREPRQRGGPGRDDRREPGARQRGPRPSGPRGDHRPYGKPRDGFHKPEPKLYSVETVVDHGFEDVADTANEGATRRIDWTIVKRTVADQRSSRIVSAVYVLRRDGVATDFTSLGAARAVVNKKIVHPEKLTRPKADYPTGKK
jgi:hypothetical protein